MKNNINWNFDNTYSKLPEPFREIINPVKVKNPKLILLNESLAKDLNLDFSEISQSELSAIFTGNELPKNSNSIAQAYAGHQFGHFTMLGDGRAVLIGEHLSKIIIDTIFNLKAQEKLLFQEMEMEEPH